MNNRDVKFSLIICGMVTFVQPTLAEQKGNIYLNPAAGYHMFGSELDIKDGASLVISSEYVISPKWGAEVSYLYGNSDVDGFSGDVDHSQYTLDGLYYTPAIGNWQPFLNAGVGHGTFDAGFADTKETQLNLGLGSRYHFNDKWSTRLQAKMINSLDDERWDSLITLGVSYAFGDKTKVAPTVILPDSDGDKIIDVNDQCPHSQNGVYVDELGCALDRDGDKIPDHLDQCPDSKSIDTIDKNGCTIVIAEPEAIKLEIHFTNNSADIPEYSKNEVKDLANLLANFLNSNVVIEGYSDNRGKASYNKILSQHRADAVRDIIIREYGIDASRVSAVGYGQENPIASNNTKEGRLANRRVIANVSYK